MTLASDLTALQAQLRGALSVNAMLAKYTSWRVGGPADYLFLPADRADLQRFLALLPATIPLTWLGLGSNTLIRDGGIDGVVIVTQGHLKTISLTAAGLLHVEAGVACGQLARHAARLSTQGLEFMAGIPGTIGGALRMNAGCYGAETWQSVTAVEVINRQGMVTERPATDFVASYRHVHGLAADEAFVAATFKLQPGDKTQSLTAIRSLLEQRNASQPTGLANCGSVFRNPPQQFAARLIEQCGLKGKKIGGAAVSTKHANFIINEHEARAEEIEALIDHVRTIVEEKTGVRLIQEVCIMGRK